MSLQTKDEEEEILYDGKYKMNTFADKWNFRTGKDIDATSWPLMITHKYEPWESELNLMLQQLASSGIPKLFMFDDDVVNFNPNPHSSKIFYLSRQ